MNLITNFNTKNNKYKHLSFKERVKIETYLSQGLSVLEISRLLGRARNTIYKEIRNGTTDQIKQNKKVSMYLADKAQAVYESNRKHSKKPYKLLKVFDFIKYVNDKFYNENWSLDEISNRVKKTKKFKDFVSSKTLYNYIDLNFLEIKNTDLPLKLRRNTKKARIRKHKMILGKSIEERPKHIEKREEFGHWEIDTVIGRYGIDDNVIMSLVERKTRYYIAVKIDNKSSKSVKNAVLNIFNSYKDKTSEIFKSITCDNGLEFAKMNDFSNVSDIYFAHPYSSYERGTNERHNGILRRFVPKYTAIRDYTYEQILHFSDIMNGIPRKIINYCTPEELFDKELDIIYSTVDN